MESAERPRSSGNVLLRGSLYVVYALLLPFGIAARYLGDRLQIRRRPEKWAERSAKAMDVAAARRQW